MIAQDAKAASAPEARSPTRVTHAGFAAAVADLPFATRQALAGALGIVEGRLDVVLPDGRVLRFEGPAPGPAATLVVRDHAFARRLAGRGDVGFGEAYLAGEWDSPDISSLLTLFGRNRAAIAALVEKKPLVRVAKALRGLLPRNTRGAARRNIAAHYDLGNSFYAAWLDEGMNYSAAVFAPGDDDLARAHRRNHRALADACGIGPGARVLEIGCGWGAFATFAARECGCHVTALTISREQHAFAQARIREAGLTDRVDVVLRDYRDERGSYDAIVSIEMFEAVGEENWDLYFRQIRDRLAPGGRAGLQAITIAEDQFPRYRREDDFIRRHVFPGGMLATRTIMHALAKRHGLNVVADEGFATDYVLTLRAWRARFDAAWPRIAAMGFDERFRRLWLYYLAYCEAGFETGNIDVRRMVIARPG